MLLKLDKYATINIKNNNFSSNNVSFLKWTKTAHRKEQFIKKLVEKAYNGVLILVGWRNTFLKLDSTAGAFFRALQSFQNSYSVERLWTTASVHSFYEETIPPLIFSCKCTQVLLNFSKFPRKADLLTNSVLIHLKRNSGIKYIVSWNQSSKLPVFILMEVIRIKRIDRHLLTGLIVIKYTALHKKLKKSLTHLFAVYPFSTHWKHQETLRFSDVFRGKERVRW